MLSDGQLPEDMGANLRRFTGQGEFEVPLVATPEVADQMTAARYEQLPTVYRFHCKFFDMADEGDQKEYAKTCELISNRVYQLIFVERDISNRSMYVEWVEPQKQASRESETVSPTHAPKHVQLGQ